MERARQICLFHIPTESKHLRHEHNLAKAYGQDKMEAPSEPDQAMSVDKSRIASFEKDGNQVLHGQSKNLVYTGFLLRCQMPLLVGYHCLCSVQHCLHLADRSFLTLWVAPALPYLTYLQKHGVDESRQVLLVHHMSQLRRHILVVLYSQALNADSFFLHN